MTTAAPRSTAADGDADLGVLLADAMSLNAVTSAVTGGTLLVGAPWLEVPLGAPAWVLAGVGVGLVLFAVTILGALVEPARLRGVAGFVVVADVVWVLAAAAVVAADLLTPLAGVLLGSVSVVVAGFAVSQTVGLRRAPTGDAIGTRWIELMATRDVAVEPASAWALVADAAGYDAFAPGISHTTTDGQLAEGMVRTCVDDGGRSWSETCTLLAPGRAFRMEVDTATYPLRYRLLLHEFGVTSQVTPHATGSRIEVTFSGRAKLGVLGRIAVHALRREDPAERIVAAYAARLEGVA